MSWIRRDLFLGRMSCRAASIGGGPGFDLFAMAFIKQYFAIGARVSCDVYDIEAEWGETVLAMAESGCEPCEASFDICDIRAGIDSSANAAFSSRIPQCNIYFFNFVVVENSSALFDTDHVFLRGISSISIPEPFLLSLVFCCLL